MKNITYKRVIPRDFFNEAKLLKCMGQLSLKILDGFLPKGIKIRIEESGEPFEIDLTGEGYLCVSNYQTTINGERVYLVTTYNSKEPYPLLCYDGDVETLVLDDNGEFTQEFIEKFTK